MGATCAPGEQDENCEEENRDMEEGGEEEANEKFAKIINDYQEDNERLKSELDSLKTQNDQGIEEREEKARKNEEVMRELTEMKDLLDKRNRALVRGRLEAALLSKATSMLSLEAKTRLCMEGDLRHHHKKRSRKAKYAEIHVSAGEVLSNDFKSGFVVMTYSDRRDAQTANRCQVLDVAVEKANNKEFAFTVKALVEGAHKDITFSCEKEEQRDDWTNAIMAALAEVKSVYDEMHKLFTLKLEFSKEKMGIRVEESVIQYVEDEKEQKVEQKVDVAKPKGKKDTGKSLEDKAVKAVEKVAKDLEKATEEYKDKDKPKAKDDQKEEVKKQEEPCELVVTNITDEDLVAAGLQVNCIVREINGRQLTGMTYSEQLGLLMTTQKPYILTFTGQNFLQHKAEPKYGYISIMKELVADGDNAVKSAFTDLVGETPFEKELEASNDKKATIQKLLSNQRRLMALLQNFTVQEMDL